MLFSRQRENGVNQYLSQYLKALQRYPQMDQVHKEFSPVQSLTCEVITRFRGSFYRNRLDSWKDRHLLVTMVFDMISPRVRIGEKKIIKIIPSYGLSSRGFDILWIIRLSLSSRRRDITAAFGISCTVSPFSCQQDFRIIPLSHCNAVPRS